MDFSLQNQNIQVPSSQEILLLKKRTFIIQNGIFTLYIIVFALKLTSFVTYSDHSFIESTPAPKNGIFRSNY